MEYYIITGKNRTGPHDIVALVRKIRNGSLTGDALLQQDDEAVIKPAREWAALAEFFNEKKDESAAPLERNKTRSISVTFARGWHFLQRNQSSTVTSGLFILAVITLAGFTHMLLPTEFQVIGYSVTFILAHFFLSCYLLSILRMTRGQPVDLAYLAGRVLPSLKSFLLSSLLISIPAVAGIALLCTATDPVMFFAGFITMALPGMLAFTLYAFTPLIILDQKCSGWEAMGISRRIVMSSGADTFGVLFTLFAINFMAGLFALLPMVLTLPVTMGAVTEIYDELFG